MSAARQKKGIFGQHRAKAGQRHCGAQHFSPGGFFETAGDGIGYGCERGQSML
jgi:hypothetical protein